MKLNNINHCGNDEFKNYIDFKENLIINLDKSKDLNKESFINTNEYDGKSNISNTENENYYYINIPNNYISYIFL